jgi:hypothetical protein
LDVISLCLRGQGCGCSRLAALAVLLRACVRGFIVQEKFYFPLEPIYCAKPRHAVSFSVSLGAGVSTKAQAFFRPSTSGPCSRIAVTWHRQGSAKGVSTHLRNYDAVLARSFPRLTRILARFAKLRRALSESICDKLTGLLWPPPQAWNRRCWRFHVRVPGAWVEGLGKAIAFPGDVRFSHSGSRNC